MKPRSISSAIDAPVPYCEYALIIVRAIAAAVMTHLVCANIASAIAFEQEPATSVQTAWTSPQIQKGGGFYRVGNPYVIAGRTYVPRDEPTYRAEGVASWYGDKFHGRLTANGETYDMYALSAAHPTLPLPSYVRVTNLENHRSIILRLNDRGPFFDSRLIDLSVSAAKLLGYYEQGLAQVRVEYFGPAELEGSDDARLAATLHHNDPRSAESSAIVRSRLTALNWIVSASRQTLPDRSLSLVDIKVPPPAN